MNKEFFQIQMGYKSSFQEQISSIKLARASFECLFEERVSDNNHVM